MINNLPWNDEINMLHLVSNELNSRKIIIFLLLKDNIPAKDYELFK